MCAPFLSCGIGVGNPVPRNAGNCSTYKKCIEQQLSDRYCVDFGRFKVRDVVFPVPGNKAKM